MAKHLISSPVDFLGEWFLPDNEGSQRIAGTLAWSSHRATLQLHDSFTQLRVAIYGDEARTYPAIYGISVSSQFITVLEASGAGSGINFGPAGLRQSERLISSWVVIGAHIFPHTLFSEVRVRIPGLQIWIGRSGVQQTLIDKTEDSPFSMIYHITGLPEETTVIPCLSATLGWGVDRNFSGDLVTDISVTSSACLRI